MGRPREFDEVKVVESALRTFWRHGYAGTSVRALLTATGLERGSLYKAFRDKHAIFERTLEGYLAASERALDECLDGADSPLLGIEQWLERASQSAAAGGLGCFAVNAMVELAPADAAIRARLAAYWDSVQRALERALCTAEAAGELRTATAPALLAACLVRTLAGIAVFARQGDETEVLPVMLSLLRG